MPLPPDNPAPGARKAAARTAAQARRRAAFDAPGRDGKVTAAAGHLRAAMDTALGPEGARCVLAGYAPMRTELDPLPALRAHAGPRCMPVVVATAAPLQFRDWTPEAAMTKGAFGVRVPVRGAWRRPRALIVPLLAFDDAGYRLGYGGGFYDRTLQALRGQGPVLALGYAFEAQHEPGGVPVDGTDQRLDGVVTEHGVRWITPPAGG